MHKHNSDNSEKGQSDRPSWIPGSGLGLWPSSCCGVYVETDGSPGESIA